MISRFEVAEKLFPFSEPIHCCLMYDRDRVGWLHTPEQVQTAIEHWKKGTLQEISFKTINSKEIIYSIENPFRLGIVPHVNDYVHYFAVDHDAHDGKPSTVQFVNNLAAFFEAEPVCFHSKSGKGVRAIYLLEEPVTTTEFLKAIKSWGFNRTGRIEIFPKTDQLTQFWLPNDPNQKTGGDTYIGGSWDKAIVKKMPPVIPAKLKNRSLDYLLGFAEQGTRHESLWITAKDLGSHHVKKELAEQLCNRGAQLCGQDLQKAKDKFEVDYQAGISETPEQSHSEKLAEPKNKISIFIHDKEGKPVYIDQFKLCDAFCEENRVLYHKSEDEIYIYEDQTGLWKRKNKNEIVHCLSQLVDQKAANHVDPDNIVSILNQKTSAFLKQVVENIKGAAVANEDIFNRKGQNIIHCKSGVLAYDKATGKFVLHPFNPSFYSRNRIEYEYDPNAKCDRFLNELLIPALEIEDIDVLQRYAGMILIGINMVQKILLIVGTPGGGKGTVMNTIEKIVGKINIALLRTWLLKERFEYSSFIGKTVIVGKDVPGDFLNQRGATQIKALSGDDFQEAEIKGARHRHQFYGNLCIVITSNSNLKVHIDSDDGAWDRRLIIIEFNKPKTEKPICNFDQILIQSEGQGILSWMIQGTEKLLNDADAGRGFPVTEAQHDRVRALLEESDSIRRFVSTCIQKQKHSNLTISEMSTAYANYCLEMGWHAESVRSFEKKIWDAMMEIHNCAKSHGVTRGGKSLRGFNGVALVANKAEAAVDLEGVFDDESFGL